MTWHAAGAGRTLPVDGVRSLAELLSATAPLVLTGAGMSTDSGIPDYRGPDGRRRVQPMQHGEFVGSGAARRRYWARSFIGWDRFSRAEPNAAHRALAVLQAHGHTGPVITQNVDGLHQRAGSDPVVELHGSLAQVVCLGCGDRTDRDRLQSLMTATNPGFVALVVGFGDGDAQPLRRIRPDGDVVVADDAIAAFVPPRCRVCRADTLKPDVVFFGGSVPKDRVEHCYALTEDAEALLVLGSSLAVMSGLRFVRRAAARGIPVAIVTHGPTRGDDLADLRVDGPLAPVLTALAGALVGEHG